MKNHLGSKVICVSLSLLVPCFFVIKFLEHAWVEFLPFVVSVYVDMIWSNSMFKNINCSTKVGF